MGRHRSTGRHHAPVQAHPERRRVVLRVICGCAACAVVIPLFLQQVPVSNPPDLTAAPTVSAVAPVALTPPPFTMQPRVDTVDLVTKVNAELSKHDDGPKAEPKDNGSKSDSKNTSAESSSDSTDTESHHSHKHGDSTPTCQ